jgi:hypothetical protein
LSANIVVDYQRPQPSADHEWNAGTKRWVLKPVIAARQARADAISAIGVLEQQSLRALREFVLELAERAGDDSPAVTLLRQTDQAIAEHRKHLTSE